MQSLIVPSICAFLFVAAGVNAWRGRLPITGIMLCAGAVVSTGAMWVSVLVDWSWSPAEGQPLWLKVNFCLGNAFSIVLAVAVLRLAMHTVRKQRHTDAFSADAHGR